MADHYTSGDPQAENYRPQRVYGEPLWAIPDLVPTVRSGVLGTWISILFIVMATSIESGRDPRPILASVRHAAYRSWPAD